MFKLYVSGIGPYEPLKEAPSYVGILIFDRDFSKVLVARKDGDTSNYLTKLNYFGEKERSHLQFAQDMIVDENGNVVYEIRRAIEKGNHMLVQIHLHKQLMPVFLGFEYKADKPLFLSSATAGAGLSPFEDWTQEVTQEWLPGTSKTPCV